MIYAIAFIIIAVVVINLIFPSKRRKSGKKSNVTLNIRKAEFVKSPEITQMIIDQRAFIAAELGRFLNNNSNVKPDKIPVIMQQINGSGFFTFYGTEKLTPEQIKEAGIKTRRKNINKDELFYFTNEGIENNYLNVIQNKISLYQAVDNCKRQLNDLQKAEAVKVNYYPNKIIEVCPKHPESKDKVIKLKNAKIYPCVDCPYDKHCNITYTINS